ncbi:hypothetical protein PINS_up002502 [Pythium insidiosum]|nr:hypothetical protein PINS_up002502 [Pythium insidiosum]
MTLKMINETLLRIRARLPPEKSYTFLTAALARDPPDPSLAYESWSVCSHCYAIFERDQQLQRVEMRFAQLLGTPDERVAALGLGRIDERSVIIDPDSPATVLPPQLTLCRMMLVVSGIYDIPAELYDAERNQLDFGGGAGGAIKEPVSRLYLRIAALGFTECIPIDSADIIPSAEQAPRGVRQRKASTSSVMSDDSALEDDDDSETRRASAVHRLSQSQLDTRNYMLPVNLIRTVHFFAPRTPLHAKLKETSGLAPFLNEDTSIQIQLIRATEPPIHDPSNQTSAYGRYEDGSSLRGQTRRAALAPHTTSKSATKAFDPHNHCVLLGATKIRMAQFRSAYVTKLDIYACMALSGEMFNIKGNIGLERIRYVDTKLVTAQYRLRAYNGVYIPDASYIASDPLTSEWMDCLRASVFNWRDQPGAKRERNVHKQRSSTERSPSRSPNRVLERPGSMTSLGASGEEMDEELEDMIERCCEDQREPKVDSTQHPASTNSQLVHTVEKEVPAKPLNRNDLKPAPQTATELNSPISMLLEKSVRSPRGGLDLTQTSANTANARTNATHRSTLAAAGRDVYIGSPVLKTPRQDVRSLWLMAVHISLAHNLVSRERAYCRWECHYEVFGQRRSAVERSERAGSPSLLSAPRGKEIRFGCTHKITIAASASALQTYLRRHSTVLIHLRNDVYASTRSQHDGEFFCRLELSHLLDKNVIEKSLEIHPAHDSPEITPREAAQLASAPPNLSLSVQLSRLNIDPVVVVANGDYIVVGVCEEDIQVLKKMV